MTLPNFIICGAQRSGTTSLYHYLAQHPDVFMSPKKEIHYFDKHYARGDAWYEDHFVAGQSCKIVGEASPEYMDHDQAPSRMQALIPRARLCFLLRNPIDRAYSAYKFNISFGQNPDESFSEVIRSDAGYKKIVKRGLYYQYIERFLELYDRDQMLILFTAELKKDPLEQVATCFRFLQVDDDFSPDVEQKFNMSNPATNSVSVFLHRKWRRTKILLLRSELVSPAFRRKTSGARASLAGILNPGLDNKKADMLPEDRAYLVNIYKEQNEQLASFLDRDLPWKQ